MLAAGYHTPGNVSEAMAMSMDNIARMVVMVMPASHHFRLVMMFGTFGGAFTSVAVWPLSLRMRLSGGRLPMMAVTLLVPSVTLVTSITALVTLTRRGSPASVVIVTHCCRA